MSIESNKAGVRSTPALMGVSLVNGDEQRRTNPLRDARYRWLAGGMLVTESAAALSVTSATIVVDALTKSALWVGATGAAFTVMFVSTLAFGVRLARRWGNWRVFRRMLGLLTLLSLALGGALASGLGGVVLFVAIEAACGLAYGCLTPAGWALQLKLAGDGTGSAVGIGGAMLALGRIVGPMLAGVLAGRIDVAAVFVVVAVLYAVAIALLAGARPSLEPGRARRPGASSMHMLEAWRQARTAPSVWIGLLACVLLAQVGVPLPAVYLVSLTTSDVAGSFAIFSTASAVGALVAQLAWGWLAMHEPVCRDRSLRWVVAGAALVTGATLSMLASQASWMLVALLGAANALCFAGITTGIHMTTMSHASAGIASVQTLVWSLSQVICRPLQGGLADWGAPAHGLLYAAVAAAAVAVLYPGLSSMRIERPENQSKSEWRTIMHKKRRAPRRWHHLWIRWPWMADHVHEFTQVVGGGFGAAFVDHVKRCAHCATERGFRTYTSGPWKGKARRLWFSTSDDGD